MQMIPDFEKLDEWEDIAKKLVDKYPERYGHIECNKLVAYIITNKEKTDIARPYEMQTDKLPMRLSNQYDYFIWFKHPEEWHEKTDNIKVALVLSALDRIDPDKPYGVGPLDYRDQSLMLRTFGYGWAYNEKIPNALENDIVFKD